MSQQEIQGFYADHPHLTAITADLNDPQPHPYLLKGMIGSAQSLLISKLFENTDLPFLIIMEDKEQAAYHLNDLERLIGEKNVLFYPGSYRRPYQIEETDNANVLLRAEVLNRINSRKKASVILTYPEALSEKVITRKELNKSILELKVGQEIDSEFINEALFEYHFERVDFVTEPGEFSVRGGIIDVFSFSHDHPFRIEFFGDEVESLRTFDIESQLSVEKKKKISIMPNVEGKLVDEKRVSFLEYMANKTAVFIEDPHVLNDKLDEMFDKAKTTFNELSKDIKHQQPEDLFCDAQLLKDQLEDYKRFFFRSSASSSFSYHKAYQFNIVPQPSFNKNFELIMENLQENHEEGFTNHICCSNEKQVKRFHDIFQEQEQTVHYKTSLINLHQGFIDRDVKLACYTDHQLFDRYHRFHLKNGYAKKQAITLKELTDLNVGDYVTHIDHGIGKFGGLQKIDNDGNKQEAVKLIYGERDVLYLSIHSLHKISKYSGKDAKIPKIYKLGSKAWKNLKKKTKTRVKKIAFDLIKLYAKRKMKKGFAFAPDSYLQHELEASFLYEDTPDQSSATKAVKEDMESEQPMDRLVCGDVGFGKTEVAIRAAFKAVDNGKQVAVLVPTTILAFQHNNTFRKRLKDFPVSIDYLNRFRTAKERRNVLEGLKSGAVDIVIGTHQLVNKNIEFKDLGLLIIDEEQKFGVSVKDKLKTIKANVDTLTLTATPIPRTLQFSLMAARDLSTIKTPPPNRYPIETQLIRFSEEVIRDAVSYEIERGGQVFFINNRVENIEEVAGFLQRIVPDASIGIGHGQMDGKKLESLMLKFIDNEYDILVSTTIIENGLDVTNANTIFINDAQNFGISDLHQMRGRVGRSNKKAFCYMITPPMSVVRDDARKRLQAIEQFSDLGSGINIAMKDLEIRGAGDILGGEQSGFINEIGFDAYQKILNEAIDELKENEFQDVYHQEEDEDETFVKEPQIDTDLSLLFPDDYVNNITERLNLYTKLNELENEQELADLKKELKDRFGDLPPQAEDLLKTVELKWIAKDIGMEKIVLKNQKMIGYFIADQESRFYKSRAFTHILQVVQENPKLGEMKQKETRNGVRLLMSFKGVDSIDKAVQSLSQLQLPKKEVPIEQEIPE
ncbi:MAG: transcription-repair coupling factor [Psychroflexus sp.]|nr:transcription-repair coupling factor [Psychroflexus sp.]